MAKLSSLNSKSKASRLRHDAKNIIDEYFQNPVRLSSLQYRTITNMISNYPGLLNDDFRPRYLERFLYPAIIRFLEENPDTLYYTKDLIKIIGMDEFSEYTVTNAMSRLSESMDSNIIAKYCNDKDKNSIGNTKCYKLNPKCAEALRFDRISKKSACRTVCGRKECAITKSGEVINTRLNTKKRLAEECRSTQEYKPGETNMFVLFGIAQSHLDRADNAKAIQFYERILKGIEEVYRTRPGDESVKHIEYEVLCKFARAYSGIKKDDYSARLVEKAIYLEPANAHARLVKRIIGANGSMPESRLLYILEGDEAILQDKELNPAGIDTDIKVLRCQ